MISSWISGSGSARASSASTFTNTSSGTGSPTPRASSPATTSAASAFGPCPAPRNLSTYRPSSSASTIAGSDPPSRSGRHVARGRHRAQHGWHDAAQMPTPLWTPPAELVERAVMTRYMRERGFELVRGPVALVGHRPGRLLGLDLGLLRRRGRRTTRCWPRARCPAPRGSRARRSTTPSTCSAARTRARWRSPTRPSCASSARSPGASCASRPRAWRRGCARSASSAATASPPTCRTSPRPSPRSWPPRRSARSGRAARPTSGRAR